MVKFFESRNRIPVVIWLWSLILRKECTDLSVKLGHLRARRSTINKDTSTTQNCPKWTGLNSHPIPNYLEISFKKLSVHTYWSNFGNQRAKVSCRLWPHRSLMLWLCFLWRSPITQLVLVVLGCWIREQWFQCDIYKSSSIISMDYSLVWPTWYRLMTISVSPPGVILTFAQLTRTQKDVMDQGRVRFSSISSFCVLLSLS